MLQAIIFDFDGVIADTERLHLRAFQEALAHRRITLDAREYFRRYLGLDDRGVLRALSRDRGLAIDDEGVGAILDDKTTRYRGFIATSPVIFDGVGASVREWSREVPLAIASGSLRAEIEAILGRDGLIDCFAAIVSAEDVTRGKPAPDPYATALEQLNRRVRADREASAISRGRAWDGAPIDAGRVAVIEDSPAGIQSAKAAGMRSVAVTSNCGAAELAAADLVVGSVAALDLGTLRDLCAA